MVAYFTVDDERCLLHLNLCNNVGPVFAALPSVRNMWISTSYPEKNELLVQWKIPINQGHTLPVSYFLIQWHPETSPSTSHWSRVDSFITSTVIRGEKGEKTPKQKSFYFLMNMIYWLHLEFCVLQSLQNKSILLRHHLLFREAVPYNKPYYC